MPSGAGRSKGLITGNVFVVDEDVDLLESFNVGGKVNPDWRPPRNGPKGSLKGKPDTRSKVLEDNTTTDKKGDGAGRSPSLFPRKPSDDVTDLDTESATKKPPVRLPFCFTPPYRSFKTIHSFHHEKRGNKSKFVPPVPQVVSAGPTAEAGVEDRKPVATTRVAEVENRLPEKEQPGTVTVVYRDNELVVGSDGKRYRLRKGAPGRMGASGPQVSGLNVLLWCHPLTVYDGGRSSTFKKSVKNLHSMV